MSVRKQVILIADNVLAWRRRAAVALQSRYDLRFAEDHDDVLEAVREGGIDLVVLDFLMPTSSPFMNGCDVIEHLRRSHVNVLVWSCAWDDIDADPLEIEEDLGAPYVSKREDLGAAVDRLLKLTAGREGATFKRYRDAACVSSS
jgi:CheY-like chemotaxis protein